MIRINIVKWKYVQEWVKGQWEILEIRIPFHLMHSSLGCNNKHTNYSNWPHHVASFNEIVSNDYHCQRTVTAAASIGHRGFLKHQHKHLEHLEQIVPQCTHLALSLPQRYQPIIELAFFSCRVCRRRRHSRSAKSSPSSHLGHHTISGRPQRSQGFSFLLVS